MGSVPEKSEGFDEINFNWTWDAKCKEHVKNYVLAKKATTRIEDLSPSAWFQQKQAQWEKSVDQWHRKQRSYEADVAKKADAKRRKEQAKIAKAKAAEKKAKADEEKKAKAAAEGK